MGETSSLRKAFPSSVGDEVDALLDRIDLKTRFPPLGAFSVEVGDETLEIPQRIYLAVKNLDRTGTLSPLQVEILNCLYTRHHDGFVRERCVEQIITSENVWVPPYIFRVLGEYVIEILGVIERNLENLNMTVYREFVRSNPRFYFTTKQRVASYWNCYYRNKYPNKDDYIGFKIVRFFEESLKERGRP